MVRRAGAFFAPEAAFFFVAAVVLVFVPEAFVAAGFLADAVFFAVVVFLAVAVTFFAAVFFAGVFFVFVFTGSTAGAAATEFISFMSRDFRRAAAFGWMSPRFAALSTALAAIRISSVASSERDVMASRARTTFERAKVKTGRLTDRRRSMTRIIFFAELVFAK